LRASPLLRNVLPLLTLLAHNVHVTIFTKKFWEELIAYFP
jgi:hypothetical protein